MALDKIVLAVDDSEYGRKAAILLEDFFNYNKHLSATVMHVIEPLATLIGGENREELNEERHVEASQLVAHTVKRLHEDGMHTQVRIVEGDIADQILAVAEETGADLIIMGAKGKGNIAGIILGSISNKVLKHSKVPVLLAK